MKNRWPFIPSVFLFIYLNHQQEKKIDHPIFICGFIAFFNTDAHKILFS